MKAINPNEIKDNFIELIGKEWMLVSAGDKEKFNTPESLSALFTFF